jgi:HPt (histidine-containing phosphotransfer) domain-containing protein
MTEEKCPIDMQRLKELSDDDPDQLREMVALYLGESDDLVKKLGVAIQMGEAKEVERLAHKWLGGSASCGMTAILPPLQELEYMGRSGLVREAEQSYTDASNQLSRIQRFLTGYLKACL